MSPKGPTRRTFLSTLVGGGVALPLLGTDGGPFPSPHRRSAPPPNHPLVVTSKINAAVREEITRVAWEIMAA